MGSRYEIGDEVGRGGMGAVLSARDPDIRRDVALKVLHGDDSQQDRLRFLNEGRITGQLEHPSIVPVYELGEDESGAPYYAMKLVRGDSLDAILSALKAGKSDAVRDYPLSRLLGIFQKVCDAIAFAHSRNVIHRDLKPENVMVGDYGEVLVLDWGIAKIRGTEDIIAETANYTIDADSADLTMGGRILGTPRFMPPEQARGDLDAIDCHSDIFSLGAMLYNILALIPPLAGNNQAAILLNASRAKVTPFDSHTHALPHCPNGRIPHSLAAVAEKAMSAKPSDRYANVAALQHKIEAYLAGFATHAEDAGAWTLVRLFVARHKLAAALVLLLGFTVIGALALNVQARRDAESATAEAEARYDGLRKTAPDLLARARQLRKDGDFEAALQRIDYALQLQPESVDLLRFRARLLQIMLRMDEAAEAFAQFADETNQTLCLEIGAKDLDLPTLTVLSPLYLALRRQERYDDALTVLRLASLDGKTLSEIVLKQVSESQIPIRSINIRQDGSCKLDCTFKDVRDLSGLRGLPITELHLGGAKKLSDLTPLAGSALTTLNIDNTSVTDLSPLKGLQLTHLSMASCAVKDFAPLSEMPLESLSLYNVKSTDLRPLANCPIKRFNCAFTYLVDLSSMSDWPLEELGISNTQVSDLSPLRGLPLRVLNIGSTKVTDIGPLAYCRELERLHMASSHFARAEVREVLAGLPKLKTLNDRDIETIWAMHRVQQIVRSSWMGPSEPWRGTLEDPGSDWADLDFGDSAWSEMRSGFAAAGVDGSWSSPLKGPTWIRHEFTLDEIPKAVSWRLLSRSPATVWPNGKSVLEPTRTANIHRQDQPFADSAKAVLRTGRNVVAVQINPTGDNTGFDLGIIAH